MEAGDHVCGRDKGLSAEGEGLTWERAFWDRLRRSPQARHGHSVGA